MNSKYIPLIQGEIAGLEAGIDSDRNLWEHSRELDYEKLDGEYLIGFGVGFYKAEQIKQRLKEENKEMPFAEKIKLIKFFVLKQDTDYDYYSKMTQEFMENVNSWGVEVISFETSIKSLEFLKEEKLQRAIENINEYNYENYLLKSIIEFEEIQNLLPAIREKKKREKIDAIQSQSEKQEIKNQLIAWIEHRKPT